MAESSHMVLLPLDDLRVVTYHSLLGHPQLVSFASLIDRDAFISAATDGQCVSGLTELDAILAQDDASARETLRVARDEYLARTRANIRFLGIMMSEACNLGCSYCIAGQNMETASAKRAVTLRWEDAKRAVDWYFSVLDPATPAYINFSGGEPLLNWPLVHRVLEYVSSTYVERPFPTKFSINTNATLITPTIAAVLRDFRVGVATSLDGTPASSDLLRVTKKAATGASKDILAGWQHLADAGHPISGYLATFGRENFSQLDESIVEFAHSMGFSWVRVDVDVIHLQDIPVSELIERLWAIYKRGKRLGVMVEGFWTTAIHNLLAPRTGDVWQHVEFFCGAVSGETVSVHPDGRLSACGFSRASLGSSRSQHFLDWNEHQRLVAAYFPGERSFCKGCMIEGSCAGGCNIAREEADAQRDDGVIHHNCALYREMTRRLLVDYFADLTDGSPTQRRSENPDLRH